MTIFILYLRKSIEHCGFIEAEIAGCRRWADRAKAGILNMLG
jgi:hypothetical protein